MNRDQILLPPEHACCRTSLLFLRPAIDGPVLSMTLPAGYDFRINHFS